MSGILTGDSTKPFECHYFIEPQVSQGGGENDWILNYEGGCSVWIRAPPNKNEYALSDFMAYKVKNGDVWLSNFTTDPEEYIILSREEAESLRKR